MEFHTSDVLNFREKSFSICFKAETLGFEDSTYEQIADRNSETIDYHCKGRSWLSSDTDVVFGNN